ncbi:hypothetical protein CPC08DRAFT_821035 [Agrocybe pediades]|nr:hypothetical protein CPC08DRAFT_821035 [Agrocybe pediades]
MQPSTDDAPISVLHEDLLFNIFLENTFLDFDDFQKGIPNGGTTALITARHCSQVSRQRRSIYLSSPSIWARLVNVEDLQLKTDYWRKEVIARTGEALLWVYGRVSYLRITETRDFVFPFLQENWARVQMLLIVDEDIYNSTTSLADRQKMWAFLKEPAPQLQRIFVGLPPSLPEAYLPPAHSLFNNDAPCLRHFCVPYRTPHISWGRNLTSATFFAKSTTEQVLKTLQHMPELVSLSIYGGDLDSKPSGLETCPQILLPKLRTLALRDGNSWLNAAIILQSITPSADCCLFTLWRNSIPFMSDRANEEYEQYEKSLKSYILPYLSLHPPPAVRLTFLLGSFFVVENDEGFAVTLDADSDLSSPSPLLKERITSACFSRVDTLGIHRIDTSLPAIIRVLEAFSSATTLIAPESVLQVLLCLDRDRISALLPILETLQVHNPGYSPMNTRVKKESPHQQFQKFRKDIGHPISVLDLGRIVNNAPIDLDHFESEYPGLLVKWSLDKDGRNVEEYRCGDGQPERLRLADIIIELIEDLDIMGPYFEGPLCF